VAKKKRKEAKEVPAAPPAEPTTEQKLAAATAERDEVTRQLELAREEVGRLLEVNSSLVDQLDELEEAEEDVEVSDLRQENDDLKAKLAVAKKGLADAMAVSALSPRLASAMSGTGHTPKPREIAPRSSAMTTVVARVDVKCRYGAERITMKKGKKYSVRSEVAEFLKRGRRVS